MICAGYKSKEDGGEVLMDSLLANCVTLFLL